MPHLILPFALAHSLLKLVGYNKFDLSLFLAHLVITVYVKGLWKYLYVKKFCKKLLFRTNLRIRKNRVYLVRIKIIGPFIKMYKVPQKLPCGYKYVYGYNLQTV